MYSEILSRLRTKEEARYLEGELDLLLEKIYSTKEGEFEQALKMNVRSWVSELIRAALSKEGVDKEEFLKGLKAELAKLKVVALTIAFDPTEASIDRFHHWVRRNLGEGIVLEINVKPVILGGAIVVFQGEYRDLSLRKRFGRLLDSDREEIFKFLSK